MENISSHRKEIEQELDRQYYHLQTKYGSLPWAKDTLERIFNFSKKGKLMRGNLVVFGAMMKQAPITEAVYTVAALMELIHAALLIHDDIMDDDPIRRGEESLYRQYEHLVSKEVKHPKKAGESLAICVGDILFFLVFEILSTIDSPHKSDMITTLSEELIMVGFGQMQDVVPQHISEKAILELYTLKTGRYTFTLPLLLGSLFTTPDPLLKTQLIAFGNTIGPLFQLSDDLLGLYGTEKIIGKPVGSDIKEGKQTLYYYLLLEKATQKERDFLFSLQGSPVPANDITSVIHLLEKYQIHEKLNTYMEKLEEETKKAIASFSIKDRYKSDLLELLAFVSQREK